MGRSFHIDLQVKVERADIPVLYDGYIDLLWQQRQQLSWRWGSFSPPEMKPGTIGQHRVVHEAAMSIKLP
jgi:hypothetical protein